MAQVDVQLITCQACGSNQLPVPKEFSGTITAKCEHCGSTIAVTAPPPLPQKNHDDGGSSSVSFVNTGPVTIYGSVTAGDSYTVNYGQQVMQNGPGVPAPEEAFEGAVTDPLTFAQTILVNYPPADGGTWDEDEVLSLYEAYVDGHLNRTLDTRNRVRAKRAAKGYASEPRPVTHSSGDDVFIPGDSVGRQQTVVTSQDGQWFVNGEPVDASHPAVQSAQQAADRAGNRARQAGADALKRAEDILRRLRP